MKTKKMFEIQKHCHILGFTQMLWKKVYILCQVKWQLDNMKYRKDLIGAYNTLANLEAQRTKIPHKVIEIKL